MNELSPWKRRRVPTWCGYKEHFLYEILSLGIVSKDSASDCTQRARVPPEEQTEGVPILVANEAEKQFIGEGLPVRSG